VVKRIKLRKIGQLGLFEAELAGLMIERCKSIVVYHGILCSNHCYARAYPVISVVMELMDLSGLNNLLQRVRWRGHNSLPPDELAYISMSLLDGLKFLHDRGILHCRLKPENMLHNSQGAVKLTDVLCEQECDHYEAVALPMRVYDSPECCQLGGIYSKAADVWSLGLVLHELATGTFPFCGDSHRQLFELVCRCPEPRLDAGSHPAELCDFMAWCLTRDVEPVPGQLENVRMPPPLEHFPAVAAVDAVTKPSPRRRASAAELLQHDFVKASACSQDDFAFWLQTLRP